MENNTNTNTGATVANNATTETVEKTYSQAEVDAMLQAESDRRVTQALDKYKKKTETQIKEAEKLASMTAEQKFQYELEQKEKELNLKEQSLTLAENKLECNKILAEKNLPIALSDLVTDVSADVMNERISVLEKCFNDSVKIEVDKRLSSVTPKGHKVNSDVVTKSKMKNMNIDELQKMYNTDPELYRSILGK